jgi:hypothetical protein
MGCATHEWIRRSVQSHRGNTPQVWNLSMGREIVNNLRMFMHYEEENVVLGMHEGLRKIPKNRENTSSFSRQIFHILDEFISHWSW